MQTTHAHDKRLVKRKYLSNTCTERHKMCGEDGKRKCDKIEFACCLLKYSME